MVWKGFSPHSLLDSHTKERLPGIGAMLFKTDNPTCNETIEEVLLSLMNHPPYRSGGDGSTLRVGDRTPAPGLVSAWTWRS